MFLKTRLTVSTSLVSLMLALGTAQQVSAQTADMVEVVGRLGISFLEEASRQENFSPPSADPATHADAATRAMDRYDEVRRAFASAQSGGRNFASVSDGIIGVSMAVGNVPGIVAGVILRGAVGYGNAELDRQSRSVSIRYLNSVSAAILEDVDYDNLHDLALNDPDELENILNRREDLLQGVRRRAADSGDTALIATTAAAAAQAAHDDARDGLLSGAAVAADVEQRDSELTTFMADTNVAPRRSEQTMKKYSVQIDDLETDVSDLSDSIVNMKDELDRFGGHRDLVVDFMFSRMGLEEKANALETGLMDRTISCPQTEPACDVTAVKAALVDRYRREDKVVRTVESIGTVLRGAGTARQIAYDLNIDVPLGIANGLKVANAVFTAFTTWSTNPLGAIQAITGLFGSKDAAAERHAAMMKFLTANFERINEQLVQIQTNQQAIMDGLVSVSEQIVDMHRDLDSRLSALQEQVFVVGENVRSLLWEDWQSCDFVFQQARNPPGLFTSGAINLSTLEFLTFEERANFATRYTGQVTTCMKEVNETVTAFRTTGGWVTFGSLLDLNRSVFQVSDDQADRLRLAAAADGVSDYRSEAARYVDAMVNPSARILSAWAKRHDIDELTLLHILAEQPMDMVMLDRILRHLGIKLDEGTTTASEPWRFTCDQEIETYALIAEITCEGEDPIGMASIYLSTALATEPFYDAARWVVVTSQLADLYRGTTSGFATSLTEVSEMTGVPRGREMIETLLAMGTIAVSYEQRLYGAITAQAIAEDVLANRPLGSDHYAILTANPYIAQNVMTILMHRWSGSTDIEDSFEGVAFVNRYTNAVIYSRSDASFSLDQLHAIFSDEQDKPWVMDRKSGKAVFVVQTDKGAVQLPLPGPMQVSEGRFDLPPSYQRLVASRELLLDRLIGYEMAQEDFVPALLAGLTLP